MPALRYLILARSRPRSCFFEHLDQRCGWRERYVGRLYRMRRNWLLNVRLGANHTIENLQQSMTGSATHALAMAKSCVFTVGHSNRTLEYFIAMLRDAGVETIVDVRSFPRSRTNPQFNIDTLQESLAPYQIGYEHWADLGGRRGRQESVERETNSLWLNPSFHNFADYALGADFRQALDRLGVLAQSKRPALMCSEAVWWRCHRRIISDHLLARGFTVRHIMDVGKITEATMTPGAEIAGDGGVSYPAR